jgi:hypothetical protein
VNNTTRRHPRSLSEAFADVRAPAIERTRASFVAGEILIGAYMLAFIAALLIGAHLVAAYWPRIETLINAFKGA